MTDKLNIANPCDHDYGDTLFRVGFGQIGTTWIYVWTRGDACDTAWEHGVDYLIENKLFGYFTTLDTSNLREAAEDLKIEWPTDEQVASLGLTANWTDWVSNEDAERILQAAEADLTCVGHTTIHELDGMPYVHSDEWFLVEVSDDEEIARVRAASRDEDG